MNKSIATKWMAALYARVSHEDNSTEYSMENQKKRLYDFVDTYEDEFQSTELYVDIGASGSNSDRKHFSRMLKDIKEKKVNCVIVKDLSRMSRNYYEAGYYLDYLFSSLNVRFISLEYPTLDSYKSPELMNSVMIPMQNVVNDDFCRQTSIKIRNILKMKREKGEFVGAFAPYGYNKHPKFKHQLIIDEDAAGVVRMIFHWFVYDRISQHNIVRKLNSLGILTPCAYKQAKGLPYYNYSINKGKLLWNLSTVRNILSNQMYIGNMVQGRQRSKNYKHKMLENVPEDEWVIVQGTHKPVVELDTFEKAQNVLSRRTRMAYPDMPLYPLSGLVRCAECNKAMQRRTAKSKYVYYRCRTYHEQSRDACSSHSIREDRLLDILHSVLNVHTQMAVDISQIQDNMSPQPQKHDYKYQLDRLIEQKERQVTRTTRYKKSIYQDWKDGVLTKEEYQNYRKQYEDEIKAAMKSITELKHEKSLVLPQRDQDNQFFQQFLSDQVLPELNHSILSELIDKIEVDKNDGLTIHLTFQDPFMALVTQ